LPVGIPIADFEIALPFGILLVEPSRPFPLPGRLPVVAVSFGLPDAEVGEDEASAPVRLALHRGEIGAVELAVSGSVGRVVDHDEVKARSGDFVRIDIIQRVAPTRDRIERRDRGCREARNGVEGEGENGSGADHGDEMRRGVYFLKVRIF
jgi:hypothetical protein